MKSVCAVFEVKKITPFQLPVVTHSCRLNEILAFIDVPVLNLFLFKVFFSFYVEKTLTQVQGTQYTVQTNNQHQ